jgi:hypothetical protein
MRVWVHVIWLKTNNSVLQTAGPKEDRKLEDLITEWKERVVACAWYMYVNAEPRPYNLTPVQHVDKFSYVNKQGRDTTVVREVADEASITRFPLSAFLAVAEGYLVKASMEIEECENQIKEARAQGQTALAAVIHDRRFQGLFRTLDLMKQEWKTVSNKWGAAAENG